MVNSSPSRCGKVHFDLLVPPTLSEVVMCELHHTVSV